MNKKIVSALLVLVMLFGSIALLLPQGSPIVASAAEEEGRLPAYAVATQTALTTSYLSAADKIAKDANTNLYLTLPTENGVYQLYCNPYTGEVIYYNHSTKEALTTNPFNAGANESISEAVKKQLLSQVVISYTGKDGNIKYMYSFTEAAERGQIQVKNIKNGIRVMYTIGRENPTYLLPVWITEESFNENLVKPFKAYLQEVEDTYGKTSSEYRSAEVLYNQLLLEGATYTRQDANDDKLSDASRKAMIKKFKLKDRDKDGDYDIIYTLDSSLTDAQKTAREALVKTYCPDYGYDDLEKDHAITEPELSVETPPLFKLSIEYTIDSASGALDIRIPANGIRYDETLFTLEYVSPLNYFGAGYMSTETYGSYQPDTNAFNSSNSVYAGSREDDTLYDGYVFYPDGSGTLFEFNDLYKTTGKPSVSWSGKVYGQDFAYYTVSGQHQETIRVPVYGLVGTTAILPEAITKDGASTDANGKKYYDLYASKTGYLAILEEGDALANLSVSFGATRHNYASVYTTYYPRPKDTYELSDSVSVSNNNEWTVVADRKYAGNYRTKVILLSDRALGDAAVAADRIPSYYPAGWVGMATAYREYLEDKGIITRLTEADVKPTLPLYLEMFGAIATTKQILSVPVDVKVPLTSFGDVKTIFGELKTAGISNINFKLTGFANGGMSSTYPVKLKWEKSVGGDDGFRDLAAYAKQEGFGVYPEFDFSYINNQKMFDGISLKGVGVKTVDNRYSSKQIYDAVYQQYDTNFNLCVATNAMEGLFEKFDKKLSQYIDDEKFLFGLSVSSLGSDLNSNFDGDNPINREDAKKDIANLFAAIEKSYGSVMTSGGNIYTVKYIDHLLSMPLKASNYRYETASVPFMAMVLHGYVNYTGEALNLSGDTQYNILKSIENGAALYYMLSYNTENIMLLKKDEELSKYYSIRYDIWKDDMLKDYKTLNDAMKDIQTYLMVDHSFIIGERVLKPYELEENKELLREAICVAVEQAISQNASTMIASLRERLPLYDLVLPFDGELIAQGTEPSSLYLYIALNQSLNTLSSDLQDMIVEAYSNGEGINDLKTILALKALKNVNLTALWDSIVLDSKGRFNEEELASLKGDIYTILVRELTDVDIPGTVEAVLARTMNKDQVRRIETMIMEGVPAGITWKEALRAIVDEGVLGEAYKATDAQLAELEAAFKDCFFDAVDDLKAIFGNTFNADVLVWFNRLIYTDADEAIIDRAIGKYASALSADGKAALKALVLKCQEQGVVLTMTDDADVQFNFNETTSNIGDGYLYEETDYTLNDERLVMVTYSNGKTGAEEKTVRFILNYNIFDVTVRLEDGTQHTIESYGFIRLGGEE